MNATTEAAERRLEQVLTAPVPTRKPTREHLLLKAAIVTADKGTFRAVISSESLDREKDIVPADSMVRALRAWMTTGKLIPLAWNHSGDPAYIIGHIDPASVKAVNGEVIANGWVDQSTEVGAQAWRLVKSGVLGFSFGYVIVNSTKRADGIRVLDEIDVYEVSATATPMQGRTRVLSWKSHEREAPTVEQLRDLEREVLGLDPRQQHLRAEMRAEMLRALRGSDTDIPRDYAKAGKRTEPRRKSAARLKIASFGC